MTFDHRTTQLHVSELDRQIEAIRTERALATAAPRRGFVERARRGTGRALIAAGVALAGREATLRIHRA
jgi:hypothetical protein